ncbi:MAG: FMN-binding negative transcriptional regulator [Pseudoxanthomonas sp.]
MFTPRAFVETDLQALDWLAAHDDFATLVTVRDGEPFVTHLPVLYSRSGDNVQIEGHWAKPNPQAAHAGDGLVILHGPHHYVSASWYPDKEPAARVPTWNYAVAHLHGKLEIVTERNALADIVARLSDHNEARVGRDWRFDALRREHVAMLGGIVGFRFRATRIEVKFKLSQNHPQANRHAVADALERLDGDNARDIAALMRQRD